MISHWLHLGMQSDLIDESYIIAKRALHNSEIDKRFRADYNDLPHVTQDASSRWSSSVRKLVRFFNIMTIFVYSYFRFKPHACPMILNLFGKFLYDSSVFPFSGQCDMVELFIFVEGSGTVALDNINYAVFKGSVVEVFPPTRYTDFNYDLSPLVLCVIASVP